MIGNILFGTLAAIGAWSILWAALGWLLPAGQGSALVCYGVPDTGIVSRWKWLNGIGLLRCPLIAVTEEVFPEEETERCSGEELLSRLETERKRFNGTGNGNPPGHHRCRGLSEL